MKEDDKGDILLPSGIQVLIVPIEKAAKIILGLPLKGVSVVAQTFGKWAMLLIDPTKNKK